MVRKFLGIKKKASRKLRRKEGLTTKQIKKLLEKIYRAETAIKNYYKEKQETQEQEAWQKMRENSKFFFSYAKRVSQYKSPVGPFVDKKNNVIKEKACIALNKQYASVFTKPEPNNALPEDYLYI